MSSDAPGLCSTPGLLEVILFLFKFLKELILLLLGSAQTERCSQRRSHGYIFSTTRSAISVLRVPSNSSFSFHRVPSNPSLSFHRVSNFKCYVKQHLKLGSNVWHSSSVRDPLCLAMLPASALRRASQR